MLREEEKRLVISILRQYGEVQHGKAVAAAARLTEKQQQALLADYREKIKPLAALATAALGAADKVEPVAPPSAKPNTQASVEADSLLVPEPPTGD